MIETLLVVLKLAVVALILAIGMGSTFSDLTHLWRRPGLLLRSLLAMYVLVPLAAFALVKLLPLPQGVKAAMLVLAVSAGAPLLPRKLGTFRSDAYVFSLVVTSSLLAIVLVPAWVALLADHFNVATEVAPTTVAATVAKTFLAPLAVGMAVRALLPELGAKLADRLLAIAGIALAVAGLAVLVLNWRVLTHIQWPGFAAVLALVAIALAIGHFLGGPDPDDRTVLAISCATRHLGVAILVAAMFPGPRTATLVVGYLVCSAIVSIPYLRWRRSVSRAAGA